LEKRGRKCAYCGAENVPLEIEHIVPRSKGGSNRLDNLTIACRSCNQEKGGTLPKVWLKQLEAKGDPRASKVDKAKKDAKNNSLKDAAHVNTTRKRIAEEMQKRFMFVELGSGALTKMNRLARGLPKEHFYDACCVGETTPLKLNIKTKYVMVWTAKGRGKRGMLVRRPRKRRKPAVHRSRQKMKFGFMTGDIVRGIQPKSGLVVSGRCDSVKATGSIVVPFEGRRVAVSWRNTKLLQRGDGWEYTQRPLEYTRPKVVEKPKPPEPPTAELPKLGQISLF
ncbi:MAG TPA: HNH endonuclease, partial [Thermotogota bacterium]|nr:HNH endonuclease [Thermotogota bacterium]